MSEDYYFFFSYSSENYRNARLRDEDRNHLDDFFLALRAKVSDLCGLPAEKVAYMAPKHLKMADNWDAQLRDALRKSRVLVSLISPGYWLSRYCKLEMSYFQRRYEEHVRAGAGDDTHRILPVFWTNSDFAYRNIWPEAAALMKRCQFTQEGLPESYPAVGLSQICELQSRENFLRLCNCLAARIVSLWDKGALPDLPVEEEPEAAEGPAAPAPAPAGDAGVFATPSANVVYVVGTRAEMEEAGLPAAEYGQSREEWTPFQAAPGETVGALTHRGAQAAGFELRSLEVSGELLPLIERARERNRPVLLVLDRRALRLGPMRARMAEYSALKQFGHCGLVAAGGREVTDEEVGLAFPEKFVPGLPNHVWHPPHDKTGYVNSVSWVLGNVRSGLMSLSPPSVTFGRSAVPGLSVPAGS